VNYRYAPRVFRREPEIVADTLYVVGGLYGNVEALDAVLAMARSEPGPVTLAFNGDFHWFDVAKTDFARIEAQSAPHARLRGNVETEIAAILKPRWVAEIITVTLTGEAPADLRLSWRSHTHARARLEAQLFGKRILFTNRDWPVPDVVAAYRSQSDAEFGFRQLKDPHVVSFSPMHHWTDSKIRVHVSYCVLALAVAHLMRRHADRAGLHLSVRELLDQLAGIQETVLLYHDGGKGRPRVQRMLTDMTPTQHKLADLFDIHQYAPTR